MNSLKYLKILAVVLMAFLFACRGQTMDQPPVHVVWNMDEQRRYEAFEENEFFTDNRAMRHPVEGTIHRGGLRNNSELYQGITDDSSFVTEVPIAVTKEVLLRGQDQFNVFCTPCHGITGNGRGVIITGGYGFVPPPSFHSERLLNMPPGQIYSAITNGVRTMFSYANQIPVKDRWAIVAYIQALQRSQNVTPDELGQYGISASRVQEISPFDSTAAAEESAPIGGVVSVELGQQLINTYGCTTCHSTESTILYAPSFRGLYGSEEVLADGSIVEVDEGYLVESMQYPAAKIVRGFRSEMPPYRDLMTDAEMYSIVAYLKTLNVGEEKGAPVDALEAATGDTLAAAPNDTLGTTANDTLETETVDTTTAETTNANPADTTDA